MVTTLWSFGGNGRVSLTVAERLAQRNIEGVRSDQGLRTM